MVELNQTMSATQSNQHTTVTSNKLPNLVHGHANNMHTVAQELEFSQSFNHLASQAHHTNREKTKNTVKMLVTKNPRGILNPVFISIVIIFYIMANESIVHILSANNNSTSVHLVAADPSPEPSPASSRTVTSSSHRMPPINGSIFGKRSVGRRTVEPDGGRKTVESRVLESDGDLNKNHLIEIVKREQLRKEQQKQKQLHTLAQQKSGLVAAKSEAISYKDIITEIIEDFLALNNESNPEEASIAFCRVIVYECNQMLSTKSQVLARQQRKRV